MPSSTFLCLENDHSAFNQQFCLQLNFSFIPQFCSLQNCQNCSIPSQCLYNILCIPVTQRLSHLVKIIYLQAYLPDLNAKFLRPCIRSVFLYTTQLLLSFCISFLLCKLFSDCSFFSPASVSVHIPFP